MSQAGSYNGSVTIPILKTITGNSGGAVGPDAIGDISLLGSGVISVDGNPGIFTETISITNGTNGQLLIGGGAAATWANLTSTGGSVSITNGANSINLETVGTAIIWNEIIAVSQGMSVNNGYIANNAGLVTLTLPVTSSVGDIIGIVGQGAGGWTVAQNAGQTIHFISSDTTTGIGGSLSSTVRYDCIELICTVADTDWVVRSSVGNITIV